MMSAFRRFGVRCCPALLVCALVAQFAFAAATAPAPIIDEPVASGVISGLIARGLPSETRYYIRQAAAHGPTVLVVGGMHGNEPAGAEAADQIRHWNVTRGRLVVIPRANPPALAANTRNVPGKPGALGNLNRNFPTTNPARGTQGPTAEHLWEFVTILKPDWVLDLHEGFDFHATNDKSVGSSIIHFDEPDTTPFAVKMVEAVNAEITDDDKQFRRVTRRGPIESGLVRASIFRLGARGMILETTTKEQPLSWRARQHRLAVHALLSDLEIVDAPAHVILPPKAPPARTDVPATLRVALYDDAGTGGNGVNDITRVINDLPGGVVRRVGAADIRDGVLDRFDVVVFPGGSGGKQAAALGEVGRECVLNFIREGGGYVGICAGAYLATCRIDTYLKAVRAYHHQPWNKGRGQVAIELTDLGRELLGGDAGPLEVRYGNGPVFMHEDGSVPDLDLPEYQILAHFTRGVEKDGQRQTVMEGTPAIVSAPFGSGRLLLISPHPESSPDLAWLVARSLTLAAGRPAVELEPATTDASEALPASAQ